ncbi:MAG TPA: hypothetical protein PKV98_19500, partial [Burkholderiaceae bacterium]|nr:hypothetical protein [Burkholderiaceae bacterium]
ALTFLAHMHDIAYIADDIADGDTDNVARSVETLLGIALVCLPEDPFYQKHAATLHPIIANAITHWAVANQYERSGDVAMFDRAFVLRSMYATLTTTAAQIVAGPINGIHWAREVGIRLWREWTDENISSYTQEHLPPAPPAAEAH